MQENKLNPLEYNNTECWQLADEFVRSNLSPQFKDDNGEEDWYDETFEMWQDVFAYISESAYLQLYNTDENTLFKLIEKRKEE
ncbi:hypothetical protein BN938_1804 [Mucinivorans hirudinis]|uniref:Uncharacterized protein n=1 Tax=Mucinivorans hirudinis TaxID=1433126 RepID=A0A060RDK8_9BACT|nr:hypothetical protein BN938_1804 [Mucinivorans hirudinis]